jgi:wyosine [tRNA(Phe)-imidazoG37] synthetase (radical SAM superfamily)
MKNNIPFGPIPSRRLGRSLGINNIPPKICTYSCIYCQVGVTYKLTRERKEFYKIEEIKEQVLKKISELKKRKEKIDYLSFVSDGEPTLDVNLGKEIELLKETGLPVAVITNSSLVNLPDVKEDLLKADWVSFKIDAVDEKIWRKVNRPHPDLSLTDIMKGIVKFNNKYQGSFNTETMLIDGINTDKKHIKKIADFIATLKMDKAYISIPTRPMASKSLKIPDEKTINIAYNLFSEKKLSVELLTGYSSIDFAATTNVREEILDITSVHPLREKDVRNILDKANKSWDTVENLLEEGEIKMIKFGKNKFFLRNFKRSLSNG